MAGPGRVSARMNRHTSTCRRADWVPRIEAPEGVIRVVGTAGPGMTQLSLALLRQAVVDP